MRVQFRRWLMSFRYINQNSLVLPIRLNGDIKSWIFSPFTRCVVSILPSSAPGRLGPDAVCRDCLNSPRPLTHPSVTCVARKGRQQELRLLEKQKDLFQIIYVFWEIVFILKVVLLFATWRWASLSIWGALFLREGIMRLKKGKGNDVFYASERVFESWNINNPHCSSHIYANLIMVLRNTPEGSLDSYLWGLLAFPWRRNNLYSY